ncbi:BCCT family transporter [Pseudomonas sp.]|uniref:BCCT family transporter n=1 Tax=Pseudomonas sp. TaxID=306 RepID=UPI00257ACC46|nr:BCCT family transporter [Pseudomonas sp.]
MNSTQSAAQSGSHTVSYTSKLMNEVDIPVFLISGGFILLFALLALWDIESMTLWVNSAFRWSTRIFGAYWQVLLLLTFCIGLVLAIGRTGRVRLGGLVRPEMPTYTWVSIIMCTLLAGGGVFWAAAEPMAHFLSPPPLFGGETGTPQAAYNALAQAFMHWGFLAWAILGTLSGIVLMHLHYEKGLPLKPRTLLYPLLGERVMTGWLGALIDACCVLAVVAGTIGPIGFLGLQVSFGLEKLFGISNNYTTQLTIICLLVGVYTLSAVSGVNRGIKILSQLNVILAVVLMLFILVFGPTSFIFDAYLQSMGIYLDKFIPMATFRADPAWLDWWTVFFWGWFLGYGPLMAMFVAKISRGRTIRQLVMMVAVVAPLITCFWFTIVGGSGLAFELSNPGSVSAAFAGFNLPGALLAITAQLPLGYLISVLFLILTVIFVTTTGDSMTYTISMVMTGTDHPRSEIRIFWGVMMGVVAALLISIGSGGISALQSFIVISAVPVSLVLLPALWNAPQIARRMADEQKL